MRSILIQIFTVIFIGASTWLLWDNWSIITGADNNKSSSAKAERPPTAIDANK